MSQNNADYSETTPESNGAALPVPSIQKSNSLARWVLLIPAALLASGVVRFIVGGVLRATLSGSTSGSDSIGEWIRTVLYYVLPCMAFVTVGGLVAPRKQFRVALLLMLFAAAASLLKHIVVQHWAGNPVGSINYIHFCLETAGLVAGVICIALQQHRPRHFNRE